MTSNSLDAARTLSVGDRTFTYYALDALIEQNIGHVPALPYSIRVLLEAALRNVDGFTVTMDDVVALADYDAASPDAHELPFMPGRVVLQDFTGVPCVVDLAAMRDAMAAWVAIPRWINPQVRATSSSTTPCRSTTSRHPPP
jgi:aconitate hydratase